MLLETLVEASRNVPLDKRHKFILSQKLNGDYLIHHGLDTKRAKTFSGDVEALANERLINLSYNGSGNPIFDVSPLGYKYYEYLKTLLESATDEVVDSIEKYIDSESFRAGYPEAFEKWNNAQQILWGPEVDKELTTIGHLCREAIQEFANTLVTQHLSTDQLKDKAKTVQRIRAVISAKKKNMGSSKSAFLYALLTYWGTVSDLIQKQEHDAQAEHERLTWEDARLVVFQSVIVMYEVDRAIGSA